MALFANPALTFLLRFHSKLFTFQACIFFFRETEKMDQQAGPQTNHVDACKEYAKVETSDRKESYQKTTDTFGYDKHEDIKKDREDEEYDVFRKETLEAKRGKAKRPVTSPEVDSAFSDFASIARPQVAQPQPVEKNGTLPSSLSTSAGPVEQNGTSSYKRGFVPRANPDKQAQRKNNLAQVEHWIKVQKGDTKRLVMGTVLKVNEYLY